MNERVRKQWRKLVSMLRGDFNSSKCKTWARMTRARIKLLRNKREASVRQMRRDIASLLQSRQDATARIRVEHVIREQNMMAANEILDLFCERLVTRLSIISKQRECPADLKEAISSLIFAAPRCSDIPELLSIRRIFLDKYGHDFVSAASDLRPDSGVNRLLVEKLSALNPPGELKLKVIKEIAKEYQVEWDTTETEAELLKPPEERLEGPRSFVSAANLPLNAGLDLPHTKAHKPTPRLSSNGTDVNFHNVASAAKVAADSAKTAVAAAKAAARLSRHAGSNVSQQEDDSGTDCSSQSLDVGNGNTHNGDLDDMGLNNTDASHNVRRAHSDIMFDDSDGDEDIHMEQPTTADVHKKVGSSNAVPGVSPPIHPKLPDYDVITARFEELKYRKT